MANTKQDQTDEQILDSEGLTIKLAGLSFDIPQPTRRNRRRIYSRLIRSWNDQTTLLDLIDEMLDALYECFPEIAKSRKQIDEAADEAEIHAAYRAVVEWLGNPIESSLRPIVESAKAEQ